MNYLRFVCVNPSIISQAQCQNITSTLSDSEFTTTTLQLHAVVDSYYQVKAVDTTSDIYIALEKIATNAVTFWVSLMLLSIMCTLHIYNLYCTHKSANKCMTLNDWSLSTRRILTQHTAQTALWTLKNLGTDVRLLKCILKCTIFWKLLRLMRLNVRFQVVLVLRCGPWRI